MPDLNPNPSQNQSVSTAQAPRSRLENLIIQASYITNIDKSFLISKLLEMSPLDKLHLEQTLLSGMVPESLQQIGQLRQQFLSKEIPKKDSDVLSKLIQKVAPSAPKVLISQSILLKPNFSGSPVPHPAVPNPAPAMINNLTQFNNLNQLMTLNPAHVTFGVNDPTEQIINDFFKKLDSMFSTIQDMVVKRSYLMSYMQSLLFKIYLSTGETALRHPELQPRSIALNQMYQIDNRKYLNKAQFQYASKISAHLRNLCAL